jgi:hypothetical protein
MAYNVKTNWFSFHSSLNHSLILSFIHSSFFDPSSYFSFILSSIVHPSFINISFIHPPFIHSFIHPSNIHSSFMACIHSSFIACIHSSLSIHSSFIHSLILHSFIHPSFQSLVKAVSFSKSQGTQLRSKYECKALRILSQYFY